MNNLKELHQEHVNKINKTFSPDVTKNLGVRFIQPKALKSLMRSVNEVIPKHMTHSLWDNIKHNVESDTPLYLSYSSLSAYLMLLVNPRLRDSPIAIDGHTGQIIVFHNKDKADNESTKVTIQCNNSNEYVFSVLDRADGLAVFSGKLKVKEGVHYKIVKLLNAFE